MKKLLLSVVFAMVALTTTFAANLNPFAYNLRSELSDDQSTLTVRYSLNSTATSVKVVVMNGNTVVAWKDCNSLGLTKGNYNTTISTAGFPTDTELTWKVEVKGAAVNSYAMHDVKYNAYHPSSIDIDNNTESPYFGRVLCNESMQKVKGLTKDNDEATNGKNYLGTENGAGIFEFNAAFEYIGSYNGGKKFPINRYGVTGDASANQAYVPRRIRISDDSRIFVTSLNSEGDVLWELNPDKLNEWTTVIADGTRSTATYAKRNIIDGSGNFIAGPNVGFDVHGSGKDLKLVMLSSADEGWGSVQAAFKCVQYNLGTEKTWNKQPSKTIFTSKALYPLQAQVQYDKDGGVWFIQYSGETNDTFKPGLAHWNVNNTDQTPDYSVARNNTRNAGFRYNNDYSKVIIANNSGSASIYDVTIKNGVPQLSNEVAVNMTEMGSNLNDFAWDYADNIYVVSNSKEFVAVYPSPHTADKVVTTPAAAEYNVVLSSNTQLNPFAYGLRSSLDANNPMQLNVSFSVNASATSVEVVVYDVETNEVAYTQVCPTYSEKHDYQLAVDLSKIPAEYRDGVKNLNWRVDVKGAAVEKPTFVKNDVRLYAPTSVDIDNNPENANFGTVFCVEGRNDAYQASNYSSYISYADGAGLYVLNADGTAREMPFQTEKVHYGYDGEVVNQPNRDKPFFGNNTFNDLNGYNAFRVRVSDDGRIFVTAFSIHGHVLWEAKKECFSATTQEEWSANTGWHKIITDEDANTFMATKKRTCSHTDCGIYSLYEGNATNGQFIAGPNLGFDVRGSGDNLKLLMLAGCKQAIVWATPEHFYCDEYDLGTKTLWNTPPSRRVFAGHSDGVDIVNPQGVQVQYDKSGNVWVCQYRATTDQGNTTLARVNRASSPTTDDKKYNITGGKFENIEATTLFRRCGAIRFNEDFTQVAIASNEYGSGGGFTVYPVNASTGMPIWAEGTKVNTYNKTGASLMDFAWDYAGNLYMAADAATNGERIAVYAMPHTADRVVSTPAASKYAFSTKPFVYDLRRTIEGDGRTKLHFMLNADAKKVQVWLIDEETKQEIRLRNYPNEKSENKDFVPYHSEGYGTVITTEDVETLGLEYGKNYSWRVDVWVTESDASKVSALAGEEHIVNLTQPVPRIVAYNLTYRPNGANQTYDFSFYANTQPTGGSISFYQNGETTPLYVHQISNLIQGDNTVSIPMATLDEKLNMEKDIVWELTLSAPESQVFGRIYKSGELNTAYATINTNPATDYFGHVYAGNQQNHVSNGSGGNIYVWAPGSGTNNNQGDRYHTIKTAYTPTLSPNDKNGFTQVSAPGIAPDGKVYFTDNGRDGGVYVMDPKNYSITSFFEGLAQNEIAQYLYDSNPVGTPSSSAHIYWPGGNTAKLFLVSTEYYTKTNIGSQNSTLHRHNAGYYIYPLTEQDGQWVHNRNWGETQKVAVTEDNIYQPNFTIVGTSRGAWYCQHRRNDLDVDESRSLMFFDNNGVRQYCSTDEDEIYGSSGSAIAVNKEETLLAMASGLGGIMFFDIAWSGDIPTLTYKYTSALNNNDVVTTLNFDYNGNLVATVGDTYNDATDKHRMVVFTMPKEGENTVTVPARFSQRVAALYADERMDVHFDENITNASPYQTVDVFRRLQAGMCNTICLPFSIENKVGTPYEKTKIFAFTGVNPGNDQVELQFSEVNAMQAGVPYLIQPENDITDLLRFSPVQVNTDFNNEGLSVTQGSGTNAITFHGAIDPTTLSVNQNYLFLVANNRLATASAGGDMLGLRGYFTVNGEVPAKAVISFREGVTTGTTSTVAPTTDGVQKVLHDQQILIIRDGETYNILGEHINTK